jgi:hypothetical protein
MRDLDRAGLADSLLLGARVTDPESHLLAPLATGHPDHRIRVLACRVLARCPDAVARAAIHWSGVQAEPQPDLAVQGCAQRHR